MRSAPKCDDCLNRKQNHYLAPIKLHVLLIPSLPKHLSKCIQKGFQNCTFQAIKNWSSDFFLWHPHFIRSWDQHRSKMCVQNKLQNRFHNWDPKCIQKEIPNWLKMRSKSWGPNVPELEWFWYQLLHTLGIMFGAFLGASCFERVC